MGSITEQYLNSEKAQKASFERGYEWSVAGKNISHLAVKYIQTWSDMKITHGCDIDSGIGLSEIYTNPPHKHCELIKAWADGAVIEVESTGESDVWIKCASSNNPEWRNTCNYRIKPEKTVNQLEIERIESEMRKLADDLKAIKDK